MGRNTIDEFKDIKNEFETIEKSFLILKLLCQKVWKKRYGQI